MGPERQRGTSNAPRLRRRSPQPRALIGPDLRLAAKPWKNRPLRSDCAYGVVDSLLSFEGVSAARLGGSNTVEDAR